jgi:prepilin-type N-terminal cleavage/methylation domain-containing protein/prepilin-type processing-associated H-X9-DG protein
MRAIQRRAFTLVELLVVIGIIAVLIGILLPTLGRARAQANNLYCQSNLRVMGQAVAMYVDQNKGILPSALGGGDGTWPWGTALSRVLHMTDVSNNVVAADKVRSREIFLDKDGQDGNGGAIGAGNVVSQNMYSCHPVLMPNSLLTWPAGTPRAGQVRRPYKLGKVKASQETVLIMDGVQILRYTGAVDGNAVSDCFNLDANRLKNTAAPKTFLYLNYDPSVDLGQSVDGGVNRDVALDTAADPNLSQGNVRWRHLRNTSANFLFCDGHVAGLKYTSRFQTELTRRMVSVPF